MATQKQTEKQDNGRKQQALARQGEPQRPIGRPLPTTRRIARTSPVSLMRRMLDDLDPGLFGWSPASSMMRRMLDDMERIFETDLVEGVERAREYAWTPRIEVRQREDKLLVCMDLPGLSQDQIEISAQDGSLVIEGERPRPEEAGEFWQSERYYGRFRRVVALPEGVDPEQVTARFENGVLEIALPLPASQVTRRIEIRAGEQREQAPSVAAPAQAQAQAQQPEKQPEKQAERQPEAR